MVTHDQDEALTLSDQIAIMRGGRLEQLGSPAEVYQAPASRFVAGFIGVSNFFSGRVEWRDGRAGRVVTESGTVLLIADCPPGRDAVTVAVRPEAIVIDPDCSADGPNSALGTIEQVVYRGYISHIYLRLSNGETLIAFQSSGPPPPGPGTRVLARWDTASNRVVHDE
jgi:putative spermidine/putrescine transport system ATP-binding protein/spermidine/putrescine transport system ATP-binding protein